MLSTPQVYKSLDDIQLDVFSHLLNFGVRVSPRGFPTVESAAISFALTDPRSRCISNPARMWSFPLALGELSWHLSGSTRADEIGTPRACLDFTRRLQWRNSRQLLWIQDILAFCTDSKLGPDA